MHQPAPPRHAPRRVEQQRGLDRVLARRFGSLVSLWMSSDSSKAVRGDSAPGFAPVKRWSPPPPSHPGDPAQSPPSELGPAASGIASSATSTTPPINGTRTVPPACPRRLDRPGRPGGRGRGGGGGGGGGAENQRGGADRKRNAKHPAKVLTLVVAHRHRTSPTRRDTFRPGPPHPSGGPLDEDPRRRSPRREDEAPRRGQVLSD